jgi:hypothetical protein
MRLWTWTGASVRSPPCSTPISGKNYEPEVFRPFIGVRLPYLETAMGAIIGEVGSIDAYLTETLRRDRGPTGHNPREAAGGVRD